ncbi:dolichyl-diphosphooligosaccharide--protein glycotransferase OST3 Ecym_5370 [Eremothecium cymbalariae DBVPG|uniref:Dolichyl-diphosphooligosaccharide--protein glycosyltransferase subunit 3 n=1 Tax=Eremothecium cymbalariae (strain CBS 270.75 / DBVPG 7215 / KCTC 17166 / NRRL Y-17582) TaxID=931890 RepID=I6NDI4_ERECY|nr:hypothetical protein Ecym_5370 [Eremothecium cymbalariae DBVPG\
MKLVGELLLQLLVLTATVINAISNAKLAKLSAKDGGIIQLNNGNFKQILSSPRSSHIVVLLTATNPQIDCNLCVEFGPDYSTLARSWINGHSDGLGGETKEHGLYFAKADFMDNTNQVFTYFSVNNVPRLFLFTPNGDVDSYEQLGIPSQSGNARVQPLVSTLKEYTGFEDYIFIEPINWGSIITTIFVSGMIAFIVRKYRPFVLSILTYRPLWGITCVSFIIALITGTMFNKIRDTPYLGLTPDRSQVQYIALRQQQFQFGVETQIMSFIYGALTSTFMLLTLGLPKLKDYYQRHKNGTENVVQFIGSICFLLIIYILFAALVAVFKLKNAEYPFRLFKLPAIL